MIRDRLIPALKREFAGWEIQFDSPPQPIATFPATQPAVGRVFVYDDGDEATVLIEKITHSHFNPYDKKLSEPQRDEIVTEDVLDFLQALFSDRVLLHCTPDGRMGGWMRLDLQNGSVELSPARWYFLWSRPYTP
ncbi:hypothetical protein HNI00_00350 [Thermoleptolyngbya oregonensis NK1-22]|uniref:Uncharacterized protein n=1 Tax=Thermoleptolyngbya oregonensis NK1-22 TaxID=2547457 RepID=A0AA97BBV0_9CYAN|nr:hypothetical protein [Thermoleptolyngbya oregonensis]WOB41801.1 hypothetical protein HNI00_00350 [Thermoleptolyngbya oregonensis NK1-22]